MKASTDERLDNLIESLSAHILFLRASGWNDSARLLEMAKLEIQTQVHSISDQELRGFCAALGPDEATASEMTGECGPGTRDAVAAQTQAPSRNTSARVVVPIATLIRRARSARKHAR